MLTLVARLREKLENEVKGTVDQQDAPSKKMKARQTAHKVSEKSTVVNCGHLQAVLCKSFDPQSGFPQQQEIFYQCAFMNCSRHCHS